jgi:hypothetical protein
VRPGLCTLILTAFALLLGGCGTEAGDRGVDSDATVAERSPASSDDLYPAAVPPEVANLFPATATRNMFLNRCSTCHTPACAAVGQRNTERWREVEESHIGYNPGLSAEDRGRIFDYLRRHFNENTPEPDVPPRLVAECPTL